MIDKFSEISQEISECEEDEKVLHVELGELCAAKSSDGSWYRWVLINIPEQFGIFLCHTICVVIKILTLAKI